MTTHTGVLRAWRSDRAFGFIDERIVLPDRKTILKSYFVHISKIVSGEPIPYSTAFFNMEPGKEGKCDLAVDVELIPSPSQAGEGGAR